MFLTALRRLLAVIFFNMGKVDDGVLRSRQGYLMYAVWPLLGLRTVINLSHKPATDPQDKFEEWLCKVLHIKYITYPTIGFTEAEKIAREIIGGKHALPLLFHCEGGKDRAGGVAGIYKWLAGFPVEDIERDWKIYGRPYHHWIDSLRQFFNDNPRGISHDHSRL